MPQPTIVFDLDGTFADTAHDIVESLNHCLSYAGLNAVSRTQVGALVGQGGRVMIARAFADQNRPLARNHHDELCDVFLAHYADNIPGTTKPYDGALEVLNRFRAAGYKTAICTNKFEKLATGLINALGLNAAFDAVCGSDTFPYRKPDPRHLTETISMAGGSSNTAVMIGDSITDIDTAKAADIPVVAVDFGYSQEPVSTYSPDRIISHYHELTLDVVEGLLRR